MNLPSVIPQRLMRPPHGTNDFTRLPDKDMLAYLERQRKKQHELLNALTRDPIENGLYDLDSATALESLRQIRKG